MANQRELKRLTGVVDEINQAEAVRLTEFVQQLRSPQGERVLQAANGYVRGLGFGMSGGDFGSGFDLVILAADDPGVNAFAEMLGYHPAFAEDRRLDVIIDIVRNPENDPNLVEVTRDVSEFIVAGALAASLCELSPERFAASVIQVALGPDAFSRVVRDVLFRKPLPDPENWPVIPDWLGNPEEIVRATCLKGIRDALVGFGQAVAANRATSDANGITSLDPNSVCAGQRVIIRGGGFGHAPPAGVLVAFPTRSGGCSEAKVQAWSDASIVVEAPANVGPGCVGFLRFPRGAGGTLAQAGATLAGELFQCLGHAAGHAALTIGELSKKLIVACPPCLPNRVNSLQGGLPTIDSFTAAGGGRYGVQFDVEPNTPLTLSWDVRQATSIDIGRTTPTGPFAPLPAPIPPKGAHALGVFVATRPQQATYQLTATNPCGVVQRSVTIRLRRTPSLRIAAIEIVQAIQRPDNSVTLVANKRTTARVFVDSGITDGFDYGQGANLMPNVSGRVVVFPAGAGHGFSAGAPFNPGGVVNARPAGTMNRNLTSHSLNFELPSEVLSGTTRVQVFVFVLGHEQDGAAWTDFSSTVVDFAPQPQQELLPLLILDLTLGMGPPTIGQYGTSLQGARARYPVAEDGFIVNPPRTLARFVDNSDVGFDILLAEIATMMFLFPATPVGGIRTVLLPRNPGYVLNGLGVPTVLITAPAFLAQAGLQATFAHEMGHVFGIGHAPCPPPGTPGAPSNIEAGLPPATDEVGMDIAPAVPPGTVAVPTVIPVGRGELMSYCGGETRWPSIVFWDMMLGRLPI